MGRKSRLMRFAAKPPLPRPWVEWVLEAGLHSQWRDRAGIDRLPCYARLGTEGTYIQFLKTARFNHREPGLSRARSKRCSRVLHEVEPVNEIENAHRPEHA